MKEVIPPMKTQISIEHWGGKQLIRVLALLLALAVAPPMLRANGLDPTGAWLLKWIVGDPLVVKNPFVLNVFHQGGTLTGDIQGESAFDPATTTVPQSPFNVISSPQSGVWQKTGWNTFAATFWVIEYRVITKPEPDSPLFQLSKVQYTGTLTHFGNKLDLDVLIVHYNESGTEIGKRAKFKADGVRITLKGVPLPIPKSRATGFMEDDLPLNQ